jgi:hypothetical protein
MEPSESEISADLILTATEKGSGISIDSLKKGDYINFKAKLIQIGNEHKLAHLHALFIEKTGAYKELSSIVVNENSLPNGLPENHDKVKLEEGEYNQELVKIVREKKYNDEGEEIPN